MIGTRMGITMGYTHHWVRHGFDTKLSGLSSLYYYGGCSMGIRLNWWIVIINQLIIWVEFPLDQTGCLKIGTPIPMVFDPFPNENGHLGVDTIFW